MNHLKAMNKTLFTEGGKLIPIEMKNLHLNIIYFQKD